MPWSAPATAQLRGPEAASSLNKYQQDTQKVKKYKLSGMKYAVYELIEPIIASEVTKVATL